MREILRSILQTSIGSNGYIRIPGGLIIQWGNVTVNETMTITLPLTYPTAQLWAGAGGGSAVDAFTTDSVFCETALVDTSSLWIKVIRADGSLGNRAVRWLSIGH
jgi:hypothetical protein